MSTTELFRLIRKDIFNIESEQIEYNLRVTDRAAYFDLVTKEEIIKYQTNNNLQINNHQREQIITQRKILKKIEERVATEFDLNKSN